jgi:uncharacterized Ntn-hydrolase superfamily protein
MSFAIVARCTRTGRLGLAVASELMAVGHLCAGAVRSNVGATITLASPFPRNNTLAIELLAQGFAPQQVLRHLQLNDPEFERRHVALLDRSGRVAAHAGAEAHDSAEPATGDGYATLGQRLPAPDFLETFVRAFERRPEEDLENRLLESLEVMRVVGLTAGAAPALRSVALIVYGNLDHSDIDLRVDLHDDPIAELRRIFDEYQPFAAYYLERGKHPRQALPQMEFADMLAASRAKEAS